MSTLENLSSTVVELRRYTLHPGRRDELIELFDAELVDTQQAVGIEVIGQFRDLDHPDTFTWFRGFRDMTARRSALEAFYGGPVWARHRDAANATMIDSDDVLLLTPVNGHGFAQVERRTGVAVGHSIVVVILHLDAAPDPAVLGSLGASLPGLIALLVTLDVDNDYPALPVRVGEHVVVAVVRGDDVAATSLITSMTIVLRGSLRRTEVLRVEPTARSRVR